MMTGTRIDLSLADLEANDPRGQSRGNTRRFRCPLDTCDGATYRGPAQPLAVNMTTGAWMCHRCGSSGLLTDDRTHRPADHRARMGRAMAKATRPRPVATAVAVVPSGNSKPTECEPSMQDIMLRAKCFSRAGSQMLFKAAN